MSYFYDDDEGIEIGAQIREILAEHNLGVFSVEQGDYVQRWGGDKKEILFPYEHGLTEYRVRIGRLSTLEEFISEFETDDEEEFKRLGTYGFDENIKYFREGLENIKNKHVEMLDCDVMFSVFCEADITNKEMDKDNELKINLENYCLYLGSTYYNCVTTMFERNIGDHMDAYHDTDNFKMVLEEQCVEVTNKNIEVIGNHSYRIYKDSKFYYTFESEIGSGTYNEIMRKIEEI